MLRDLMPLILILLFCFATLAAVHFITVWQRKKTADTAPSIEPLTEQDRREIDTLAAVIRASGARMATALEPDPSLPAPAFTDTIIGGVRAMASGEDWPNDAKGRPLDGLMQVNLAKMPNMPGELKGLALICVYFDHEELEATIREYAGLDGLVEVQPPGKQQECYPARFIEFLDRAPHFGYSEFVPNWKGRSRAWQNALEERVDEPLLDVKSDIAWQCKVGGWPAPVQNPINRPLSLQVGYDDVARVNLVDAGCLYLWRVLDADGARWETELEFY